jgi:hypothetical protein
MDIPITSGRKTLFFPAKSVKIVEWESGSQTHSFAFGVPNPYCNYNGIIL